MELHNLQAIIFHPFSLFFSFLPFSLYKWLLFSLFFSLLFFLCKWLFFSIGAPKKNLPPSPPKLPIIGNLHQLGLNTHRTFHAMAQRYGPLMLLHLGRSPTLVVSSANTAREIMKVHDTVFADRAKLSIMQRILYNQKNVSISPYGPYWRQMKSICITQLLSSVRVRSFRDIREEETTLLMKKIEEYSYATFDKTKLKSSYSQTQHNHILGSMNLSELFTSLSNGVICRVAFGRKYEEQGGRRSRDQVEEMGALFTTFNMSDFIPWLGWVNYVNGLNRRVEKLFREVDVFLDQIIDDHMVRGSKEKVDFVDILLEIQKNSPDCEDFMRRENIKAIILDMFTAGTDTSSAVLEWAMTELLRHPQAMEKVQEEVRRIDQGKSLVTEDDIQEMHYLKAVIKETMRLHPPLPLLVPRESIEDVKVQEYDILAKTRVFINAWAIGRDPESWEEAEEFRPERFLNNLIDFKGHDFQLIPFGAGRRGCPGITFAITIIELVLANILRKFDWMVPEKLGKEGLDITESSGMSTHRQFPLIVSVRRQW
ncbi:cytochrome P450 71A1-like [Malania oleifera]|uniref:cytochrome P450 71A1-like n=1 Tax=Malania oleifera TaxID=397392 RepID=UPI0025ADEDD9|nr:cytochrome P450 71A1-like [Malania oleifera]